MKENEGVFKDSLQWLAERLRCRSGWQMLREANERQMPMIQAALKNDREVSMYELVMKETSIFNSSERNEELQNLKNRLIRRLDGLLLDLKMWKTMHNKEQVRGNCNEIELLLIEEFGMNIQQIDLIEEKQVRFSRYVEKKNGGYCLTSDRDGNSIWLKDGEKVDPRFRLVDNGIGDMHAVEAAREFQMWLNEYGITRLDWMLEADIIYPALFEVMNYSFEGF